jgi:hypothetical protein
MKNKKEKTIRYAPNRRIMPAQASNYIHHLPDYMTAHPEAVLIPFCRESSLNQGRHGNSLKQQEIRLHDFLMKYQQNVAEPPARVTESSRRCDSRIRFEQVIDRAISLREQTKRPVALVALTRDRFLRSNCFNGNNRTDPPNAYEFEQLMELCGPIHLVTCHLPDQTASESRSFAIQRGQCSSWNKPGRPQKREVGYRKGIKQKFFAELGRVVTNHFLSCREGADEWNARHPAFRVHYSTVSRWIKST